MFEETNNGLAFHVDRIFGRMRVVVLEMVADGTNWTVDTAGTTPGITAAAGGTTVALSGIPTGARYWFGGQPDIVGNPATMVLTSHDATAGTITLTASAVTAALRFQWFFLVNRTG